MDNKIEKLDIQLKNTDEELRKEYQKTVDSHMKKGLLKYFEKDYPNGFEDYKKNNKYGTLTGYGQQRLIDKINHLAGELNRHKNYVCKYCHKIEKLKE